MDFSINNCYFYLNRGSANGGIIYSMHASNQVFLKINNSKIFKNSAEIGLLLI
jgi:hypothetical protein